MLVRTRKRTHALVYGVLQILDDVPFARTHRTIDGRVVLWPRVIFRTRSESFSTVGWSPSVSAVSSSVAFVSSKYDITLKLVVSFAVLCHWTEELAFSPIFELSTVAACFFKKKRRGHMQAPSWLLSLSRANLNGERDVIVEMGPDGLKILVFIWTCTPLGPFATIRAVWSSYQLQVISRWYVCKSKPSLYRWLTGWMAFSRWSFLYD